MRSDVRNATCLNSIISKRVFASLYRSGIPINSTSAVSRFREELSFLIEKKTKPLRPALGSSANADVCTSVQSTQMRTILFYVASCTSYSHIPTCFTCSFDSDQKMSITRWTNEYRLQTVKWIYEMILKSNRIEGIKRIPVLSVEKSDLYFWRIRRWHLQFNAPANEWTFVGKISLTLLELLKLHVCRAHLSWRTFQCTRPLIVIITWYRTASITETWRFIRIHFMHNCIELPPHKVHY